MQLEYDKGKWNNLLEYLRSLDPNMVHQLVQHILRCFFVDDARPSFVEQSVEGNVDNRTDSDELSNTVATSRDYLAKLLFWLVHQYMSFYF